MENENYKCLSSYLFTGNKELITQVEVVPYTEIDFTNGFLENQKLQQRLFERDCHTNALKISFAYPDIEYVTGEAINIIPVQHSWNCYKGQYFDMTWELFNEIAGVEYYQVVCGKLSTLIDDGYAFDSPKDIFTQWINRPEIKSQHPNSPWYKIKNQQQERHE